MEYKVIVDLKQQSAVLDTATLIDTDVLADAQAKFAEAEALAELSEDLNDDYGTKYVPSDPTAAKSRQAGNWSNPSTWVGGILPSATRRAFVNHAVVADGGAALELWVVNGSLTIAGETHVYGSAVIYGGLSGSTGKLLFHVANDQAFTGNTAPGPYSANADFHPEDTGLWFMDGSVTNIVAPPVTPWLDALPLTSSFTALLYGGKSLQTITSDHATLAATPVGWQAGDVLLLTAVNGGYTLANLNSINGTSITYTLQAGGSFDAPTLQVRNRFARPKIANLTRRLVIASADVTEGAPNKRAHTNGLHGAVTSIKNVEFRNLGPRAKLGRYPIHFHHTHHTGGLIEGCTVWQDVSSAGSRFITVHNSEGVILRNNVCLRSQGHGIFFESGQEINNTVEGNLTVDVRAPEEIAHFQQSEFPDTYHYWLRGRNTIGGNVAVGGREGIVLLSHNVSGQSQLPAVSTDFTAFGTGKYAISFGVEGTQFIRPIVAFALQSGTTPGSFFVKQGLCSLDDPFMLYNGETEPVYPSQIYLSGNRQFTVTNGLLVGKVGLHQHYSSIATFVGTQFNCSMLMHPTYWAIGTSMTNCDMEIATFFQGSYPKNRNGAGLLRVVNATGNIKGTVYTSGAPFSADFTGTAFTLPVFAGVTEAAGGKKLNSPAPTTGFIRLPANLLNWSAMWSVVPTGTAHGTMYSAPHENLTTWQASTIGGYPDGFPAGVYDVKVINSGVTTNKTLTVVAGAITDF